MTNDNPARETLARLRASIDNIDSAIVHMLAERFRCTEAVGELKAVNELPPHDPERESAQANRLRVLAGQAGLDPDFAERLHRIVVEEAVRNHRAIATRRKQNP